MKSNNSIRRAILRFLHEKVFRHDIGHEPNKFTNFIAAVFMPIEYIVGKNTAMHYDWSSDVYTLDGMKITGKFLQALNDDKTKNPRRHARRYIAFLNCINRIDRGELTAYIGLNWIVLNYKHYESLCKAADKNEPK